MEQNNIYYFESQPHDFATNDQILFPQATTQQQHAAHVFTQSSPKPTSSILSQNTQIFGQSVPQQLQPSLSPVFQNPEDETSAKPQKRGRKGLKHEKVWSSGETEHLINLWSQHEVLYKVSCPGYMDKNKKQLALVAIAAELNCSESEVQKKMHSMKTYYGTLRQNYEESKRKSGSGRADLKKPNWPWYALMEFLNDNLTSKRTYSNMRQNEASSEIDDLESHESFYVTPKSKNNRSKGQSSCQQDLLYVTQSALMDKALNVLSTPKPNAQPSEKSIIIAATAFLCSSDILNYNKI